LSEVYRKAGYSVLTAEHGRDALTQLETTPVDLIITDLSIPVMNGVELCRAVHANPATRAIPLVALSMTEHAAGLFDVPIAGMLLKPCSVSYGICLNSVHRGEVWRGGSLSKKNSLHCFLTDSVSQLVNMAKALLD
jgi:CheY-like chemotaxis protein